MIIFLSFFILLSLTFIPYCVLKEHNYNITLENPLNISNIKKNEIYNFYLQIKIKHDPKLRIKIIIPNEITANELEGDIILVSDCMIAVSRDYIKSYPDRTIKFLFKYYTESNKLKLVFSREFNLSYFYILVYTGKSFDISKGIINKFNNISESLNYQFFILDVKRFQKMNFTISAKSDNYYVPFDYVYITEYNNKETYYDNYDYREKIDFSFLEKNKGFYNKNYTINFIYDIKNYTTVSLLLGFLCDIQNLSIYVDSVGGEYDFNDNDDIKNISNIKHGFPFYFFAKANLFQTSLITFKIKNFTNIPFDFIDIYEFRNKLDLKYKIIEKQNITNYIIKNDEIIISFYYQIKSRYITDIAFKIIPKYNFDFFIVKIENIGGSYILTDADNKQFYKIYPICEYYFWVQISQFQKLNVKIKYNSLEENSLNNNIDIYEYYHNSINSSIYKYTNQSIIPQKNNNNEYIVSLSYLINDSQTKYALFKIKPINYVAYFELYINIQGNIYYLKNNEQKNITNINPGNIIYFFINANFYNELFINIVYKSENKEAIKYIIINEYNKEKDINYIKSQNKSYIIQKIEEQYIFNFSYKPISPSVKCIALILETNTKIDYLLTKIDIGGGFYELNSIKNISNIIASSVYFFLVKISMFQKLEFKIIMNNININNNPFIYAKIYEKQNKFDNITNKYYKQNFINEIKSGKLEQYFIYSINDFNTDYLLIEFIPNINIESILIKYQITKNENTLYNLHNKENKIINKITSNIPLYFKINSQQFQQVKINLKTNSNNKNNIPFEYIEIYELINENKFNQYNKYNNKSINFIKNNNDILSSEFSYMIESFNSNNIIIKIIPELSLTFLEINMNEGGGYFELEKNSTNNIANLLSDFSYYFFILSSKGEYLNIKLIFNSNKTEQFNKLYLYEYSNKNSPSNYLKYSEVKFNTEICDNKSIIYLSYKVQNELTNFIALAIIPNYNINFVELLIESQIDKKYQFSFSVEKILTIILFIIIFITAILFFIYIKKVRAKYKKRQEKKNKFKKYDLSALSIELNST